MQTSIGWRLTEPLRRAQRAAPQDGDGRRRVAARSSVAEQPADLGLVDRGVAAALAQARQPLGEREGAASRAACAGTASRRRSRCSARVRLGSICCCERRRGAARGWPPAARARGCGPTARRTAATASAHGASSSHTTPRPKNDGTTARRRPSRSATKSSTAVSTPLRGPPSRAAALRYGQPAGGGCPARPGDRPPPATIGWRAPPGSARGRSSRRGARAASTTSWKSSSGSGSAAGALGDQPQLLDHRPVVVVAVDDERVGELDRAQRLVARRADELEVVALLVEPLERRLRRRVDRADAARRPWRPTRASSSVRSPANAPTSSDRPRPAAVEAGDHQLGVVDERHAPAVGVVAVGVDREVGAMHGGASVDADRRSVDWLAA